MFKKKRYKKQTIAKLQLFIQKESYNGQVNFSNAKLTTNTLYTVLNKEVNIIPHYNNVTKKKIYNINNTIC